MKMKVVVEVALEDPRSTMLKVDRPFAMMRREMRKEGEREREGRERTEKEHDEGGRTSHSIH